MRRLKFSPRQAKGGCDSAGKPNRREPSLEGKAYGGDENTRNLWTRSRQRVVASCCISECRAIEMIDHEGVASTPFLHFGERVRMLAVGEKPDLPLFGVLDQSVVSLPR